MSTIYLVTTIVDCEGYEVIKAFDNKLDASSLRDECEKYDKTRVNSPDIDEDWTEWTRLDDDWQDNHPSGNITFADGYGIVETELN